MFEKIRKMKNQKGFTLVELIVVLVILAILAAMLVPALTGYIDKANNEKIIATTRQVVMAAQTEVSEAYASKKLTDNTEITIEDKGTDGSAAKAVTGESIAKLAEVGEISKDATGEYSGSKFKLKNGITKIVITYQGNGHVSKVELTQGTKKCTYMESGITGTFTYTSGNYGVGAAD